MGCTSPSRRRPHSCLFIAVVAALALLCVYAPSVVQGVQLSKTKNDLDAMSFFVDDTHSPMLSRPAPLGTNSSLIEVNASNESVRSQGESQNSLDTASKTSSQGAVSSKKITDMVRRSTSESLTKNLIKNVKSKIHNNGAHQGQLLSKAESKFPTVKFKFQGNSFQRYTPIGTKQLVSKAKTLSKEQVKEMQERAKEEQKQAMEQQKEIAAHNSQIQKKTQAFMARLNKIAAFENQFVTDYKKGDPSDMDLKTEQAVTDVRKNYQAEMVVALQNSIRQAQAHIQDKMMLVSSEEMMVKNAHQNVQIAQKELQTIQKLNAAEAANEAKKLVAEKKAEQQKEMEERAKEMEIEKEKREKEREAEIAAQEKEMEAQAKELEAIQNSASLL